MKINPALPLHRRGRPPVLPTKLWPVLDNFPQKVSFPLFPHYFIVHPFPLTNIILTVALMFSLTFLFFLYQHLLYLFYS